MAACCVAIVGRPNVGKSALFNALCGRTISIVDKTAGVTRDRVSAEIVRNDRRFELVDTGGMGMETTGELASDIELQISIALDQAEVTLFVVDARGGVQPLDKEITDRLRKGQKKVILVANKCDRQEQEKAAVDFFSLGLGEPVNVSAIHRRNISGLLERLAEMLPPDAGQPERAEPMKLAFVGRRNVGKSTVINRLAGQPRVIASPMPGTTRDAVDVRFDVGELTFTAIDTAGLRQKKQMRDSVDVQSLARAWGAIRRADVVVHMVDAPSEISRVDKNLAAYVLCHYKPCVLAANKMDMVGDIPPGEFVEYVHAQLTGLPFAPVVCMSALTGGGVMEMLNAAQELFEQGGIRVKTSDMNEAMLQITSRQPPPSRGHHQGKIHYATQVEVRPPTVALFTNDAAQITADYRRYLANQVRRSFGYSSIPIKFVVKARKALKKAT